MIADTDRIRLRHVTVLSRVTQQKSCLNSSRSTCFKIWILFCFNTTAIYRRKSFKGMVDSIFVSAVLRFGPSSWCTKIALDSKLNRKLDGGKYEDFLAQILNCRHESHESPAANIKTFYLRSWIAVMSLHKNNAFVSYPNL